jgi:hypothetical protein
MRSLPTYLGTRVIGIVGPSTDIIPTPGGKQRHLLRICRTSRITTVAFLGLSGLPCMKEKQESRGDLRCALFRNADRHRFGPF